jgi:hypothetical protein
MKGLVNLLYDTIRALGNSSTIIIVRLKAGGIEVNKQVPEENARHGRRQAIQTEEQSSTSSTFGTSQQPQGDDAGVNTDEHEDTHADLAAGVDGLSATLGHMAAYFSGRANADDMDILSFSLYHLFCCVDSLYRTALPELLNSTTATTSEHSLTDDLLHRQFSWSKLRAIQHTTRRMEALCNLLSDATRCILDALDSTSEDGTSAEHTVLQPGALAQEDEQDWLQALNAEDWSEAIGILTESLGYWQQSYSQLALFSKYFAAVIPTVSLLVQLDEVFNALLDNSGAIFGDILPGFEAISVGDDDAVATLLFDLMHQVDQLLGQFDAALESLHTLIEHFALISNR